MSAALHFVRRMAYGAAPRGKRRARWLRPFISLAFALPALGGAAIAMLLFAVDPYDVRPWGLAPRLGDYSYPGLEMPRLVRAATGQEHDLILFGGSTTMPVTQDQLATAFGAHSPVNLSYSLPAPADTQVVLDHIMSTPGLKRALLAIDHTQMRDDNFAHATGRAALNTFAMPWYGASDFGFATARAALNRLRTGEYTLAEWKAEFVATNQTATPVTQVPMLANEMAAIRVHPPIGLFDATGLPQCSRYVFISQALIPALRKAEARNVKVDLFFPPIPFETYALWQARDIGGSDWMAGSRLEQVIHFHACIVEAVAAARLKTVNIHATDLDSFIAGNLENYRDTVHILNRAAFARVLQNLASGRFRLCPAALDNYRNEFRERLRRRLASQPLLANEAVPHCRPAN